MIAPSIVRILVSWRSWPASRASVASSMIASKAPTIMPSRQLYQNMRARLKEDSSPVTRVVTTAPENFLKMALRPIALRARSPEEKPLKNRVGSRSSRSQTAGTSVADDLPLDPQEDQALDNLEDGGRDGECDQEHAQGEELGHARGGRIDPSAGKVGLGDHLVDQYARCDRHGEPQQAPRTASTRTSLVSRATPGRLKRSRSASPSE